MSSRRRPIRSLVLCTLAVLFAFTVSGCKKQESSGQNTRLRGTAGAEAREVPPGQAPLIIELPKPVFVGTEKPIDIENLEPLSKDPRPVLMVPEGTELLSRNQPVTSSDENPIIGWLDLVTDGDKEATDGCWVELGPGVQWVQLDLGQPKQIHAIVVWHEHRQAVVCKDVVIRIADDVDFITNVRTVFNNDMDNSAGLGAGTDMHYVETNEGRLIPVEGLTAQYVRFYSNGNTANDVNRYTEVEVYGKGLE